MSEDNWRAQLEKEHRDLVVRSFTRADAWHVGSSIVTSALEAALPIAVDIRTVTGILFHASLPGATADNDEWIRRKSATALRFEMSTALLAARSAADGPDYFQAGWLDPADYTLAGGAVPVRVEKGGVVAVVTVSGLESAKDHNLVVQALRAT